MTAERTLLVVSDVHAFASRSSGAASFVDLSDGTRHRNPLRDLASYLTERSIKADLVICPGDICNRADFVGFQKAWPILKEISDSVGATDIVATCGNHDLNSRFLGDTAAEDPDPKGNLQLVAPPFPFPSEVHNDRYWARNFLIYRPLPEILCVALNTSAYHGGSPDEIEYGRVSGRTIERIVRELEAESSADMYLLVCHHHLLPYAVSSRSISDREYVKKGQSLLDALERASTSPWLVIHGHRHIPRIWYGPSTSADAPILLSAGSLGASYPGVENQFHLLRVGTSSSPDFHRYTCHLESHSWSIVDGWGPADESSRGLPAECGIGYRGRPTDIVEAMNKALGEKEFLSWEKVLEEVPGIRFITPLEFHRVKELSAKRKIKFLNEGGKIDQIGRVATT